MSTALNPAPLRARPAACVSKRDAPSELRSIGSIPLAHARGWNRRRASERGVTAVQMAVIFVPVLAGMIGFAVDLGILYSVRAELRTAAQSIALAAAQQLNGTDAAAQNASDAGLRTVETDSGFGNRYYFHGNPVGASSATGSSNIDTPTLHATLVDALAGDNETGGPLARHIRVTLNAQTPVLFWGLLPVVTDRNITINVSAVAGMSAPLCQACGIEPFTLTAVDLTDPQDFGFIIGQKYTLYYNCNGASPPLLAGSAAPRPYTLLNRYNADAVTFAADQTQAYRQGAGGLPGSTNTALSCFRVNAIESLWPTLVVNNCNATTAPLPQAITGAICGLYSRFDSTLPAQCANIAEVDSLASAYPPDTDAADYASYSDYTGNGRRLLTVPIVDTFAGTPTIQGFRQFLVMPDPGGIANNPADAFGRFIAIYAGSVAPVKQGRFDGCQLSFGPGKVVLH